MFLGRKKRVSRTYAYLKGVNEGKKKDDIKKTKTNRQRERY